MCSARLLHWIVWYKTNCSELCILLLNFGTGWHDKSWVCPRWEAYSDIRAYHASPMLAYKALQGLVAALHLSLALYYSHCIHTPQEEKPSFHVFLCHTGILNSSVPSKWKLTDCGVYWKKKCMAFRDLPSHKKSHSRRYYEGYRGDNFTQQRD